ncbi:MAG: cupin domain-containing protein [Bryobacteraceae bacterium]
MAAAAPYTFIPNVDPAAVVPESGILSRTLHNDDQNKVVQFTFAPGAELSAHTAPFPASIYIVRGEADLRLGDNTHHAAAGAFAQMSAKLEHAIRARTELVMLLVMNKGARS